MHELPVTEGILAVALDAASRHHASRITTIDLVIGELGSIVDDSIQFYYGFHRLEFTLNLRETSRFQTGCDCVPIASVS